MLLHILAHNLKYSVVNFDYYISKETISRKFDDVLRAKSNSFINLMKKVNGSHAQPKSPHANF